MKTTVISAKYQVVIPKDVRSKTSIRPGQKVRVSVGADGNICIDTTTPVNSAKGKFPGLWGKNPDDYLVESRSNASNDRT